uniref:Uncharacterized protein n=1 Tax=Nelumbo nucifera TaxID=4432 RepID=A0A822Y5A4_NELNU|nr:TPA_asm: hypothetical protein HUJ06_029105 [Nelumbo nucifera]
MNSGWNNMLSQLLIHYPRPIANLGNSNNTNHNPSNVVYHLNPAIRLWVVAGGLN